MSDPSRLISGRYRLGELLGTGGSASVFAAVDAIDGAQVALKILHPHLSDRPAARDAFLAEARRAELLRHPNIVGVLGVGVDEAGDAPLAWIALERAAGSSLSEHIATHGPLPPDEAAAVIDGILFALEAAHAIGLIHRDVSPANVMVAPDARGALHVEGVRLLDFGLADAAGKAALGSDDLLSIEATGRAGVLGNVNYMSPEQVRGEAVDGRGDLYQAGAVLYFALTGRPPFPRETTGQTMRAHLTAPPPVPSVLDRRIPRTLDRVVVRAMLKEPGDRFASVGAMRAALAGPAPVAAAAAPQEVTRVLGRTMVPPRVPGAPTPTPDGAHLAAGPVRHVRSRAGTWFGVTVAAIIAAMIVVVAATGSPTASGGTEPPAAAPAEAPVQTESSSPPSAEPEPAASLSPLLTVPDVARHTIAEALRALAEAGLTASEIRRVDSPFAADTVLESTPAAGARLRAGEEVLLTVASGSNTIPDVAGQGRDAAAAIVQAAGFAPSFAYRAAPAGTPAGAIVGTDPAAGTVYAVGMSITILEAVPEAPTPTPTPSRTTPTPTPTVTPTGGP